MPQSPDSDRPPMGDVVKLARYYRQAPLENDYLESTKTELYALTSLFVDKVVPAFLFNREPVIRPTDGPTDMSRLYAHFWNTTFFRFQDVVFNYVSNTLMESGSRDYVMLERLWQVGQRLYRQKLTDDITTVGNYIMGGVGTAESIMIPVLQAIPHIWKTDKKSMPTAREALSVAKQSFAFINELAGTNVRNLNVLPELYYAVGEYDYLAPSLFYLKPQGGSYSIAVKPDVIDGIRKKTGYWLDDLPANDLTIGCPALPNGNIRKLWDWHVEQAEMLYTLQLSPENVKNATVTL